MKTERQNNNGVRVTFPKKSEGVFLNKFAMQQIVRQSGPIQIKVDGLWSSEQSTTKVSVEAKRIIFSSLQEYCIGRDTYLAWDELEAMQTEDRNQQQPIEKPVLPEAAFDRLFTARRTGKPVVIFVPWGVRPKGEFGQTERAAFDRLTRVQNILTTRNIRSNLLFMPADLYATEINNQVAIKEANDYFGTVTTEATNRGFTVAPWSVLRQTYRDLYNLRASQLTAEEIIRILSPNKVSGALDTASRRSGYTDQQDMQNAAFAYLRERICEAEIIEDVYKPIKVSVVPKNKDTEVDRDLPRLYLIPPAVQLPWLK